MKIKRITTLGFRGLPDRTYELVDAKGNPQDAVFVTGPSGSGKTTLLDAIVAAKETIAPYGSPRSPAGYIRKGEGAAKVRVEWWLTDEEVARAGDTKHDFVSESIFRTEFGAPPPVDRGLASVLAEYDLDPEIGKVEYFHASRRMPTEARAGAMGGSLAADRMARLLKDSSKYENLIPFLTDLALGLVDMSGQGKPGVETFNRALAALCGSARFRGVERIDNALEPRFVDRRDTMLSLWQLSESARQAILFTASFLRSGVNHSIVLVDTPELHLTSAEARAISAGLAQLGKDNQIVFATGSTDVVAGAHPSHVIALDGEKGRAS
ncbi:MAG TPA: ATP-binding protein [Minicystis sp.]|nr:ATP-binding protein [Minicystis sp.]